ncbi:Uncharacterised protein [Bacillus licheniformis]|nr:Uncharacterised protein [Bacillus licheniformis]
MAKKGYIQLTNGKKSSLNYIRMRRRELSPTLKNLQTKGSMTG